MCVRAHTRASFCVGGLVGVAAGGCVCACMRAHCKLFRNKDYTILSSHNSIRLLNPESHAGCRL